MAAIRVIFDGHAFIPQEPVLLPAKSEAFVLIDSEVAQNELNDAVRNYYQSSPDADDTAWANATSIQSHRAWDED